jgi:hypothetical protein
MIIRLNPHDASVLARVAQYEKLPPEERRRMLDSVGPEARSIGLVLLELAPPASAEVAATAIAIKTWVQNNRNYRRQGTEAPSSVPEAALNPAA